MALHGRGLWRAFAEWGSFKDIPEGYWVYVYPYWFIWGEQTKITSVPRAHTGHENGGHAATQERWGRSRVLLSTLATVLLLSCSCSCFFFHNGEMSKSKSKSKSKRKHFLARQNREEHPRSI